ncbi:MAG: threonine synthase [Pseudomonadota bacterium]
MSLSFVSTREGVRRSLPAALLQGLAEDGGLYVPESLPRFTAADFAGATTLTAIAERYLEPFFEGTELAADLAEICRETFVFPIPLTAIDRGNAAERLFLLELFHGPTAAFKDVGARFLAACMSRLVQRDDDEPPVTILVATSGDTGGAVAAAFHRRPGFEVGVLFPLDRVSPRQQQQLTCWGDNIRAFAVHGNFDDCQRLVKAAFADVQLGTEFRFSSANSINIGRLLPQSVYYAHASLLHYRDTGKPLALVIPTGNLGNGLAAVLARAAGLPIADIVFATNANRTIPDYFASGQYEARATEPTLASAMDVGNPSNMERLRFLFGEVDELTGLVSAASVDDAAIRTSLKATYDEFGLAVCPHTATGFDVWRHLAEERRTAHDWAIAATAHPAKFETVVEPLLERPVEIPPALAALLDAPASFVEIEPSLDAFKSALRGAR